MKDKKSFYLLIVQIENFITARDAVARIIRSLKTLIINVIQFITFYMNPKLTNVTLKSLIQERLLFEK